MRSIPARLAAEWRERTRGLGDAPGSGRTFTIAKLGWSWLPAQEREGTGLNLSMSELAAGLAARGHRVHSLRAGGVYSLRPGMRIGLQEVWRGVACYELFNSPNVATANFNFRNVRGQIASPGESGLVVSWLRAIGADVAHIHSFEGYGFDLVGAIRGAGIPVVVTPHNYYTLCPQVDLMRGERETCIDYDGGRRCVGCIETGSPGEERFARAWRKSVGKVLGPDLAGRLLRVMFPAGKPASERAPMPASAPDVNERLLEAGVHLRVLNDYGRRRAASVAALNRANLVLCPGRFLMRVHEAMGVEAARLRHVLVGQPHLDEIRRRVESDGMYRAPAWRATDGRAPVFAYFGSVKPNKGLETLCRAIGEMGEGVRARFVVWAGGDTLRHRALCGANAGKVEWHGAYTPADVVKAVGSYDVGVFPNLGLENSPFVLLEYLSAGRYVIASRLGASRDWVEEGRNGTMVCAGDHAALARAIVNIANGETVLPTACEVHANSALETYEGYVSAVERAYADVTGG